MLVGGILLLRRREDRGTPPAAPVPVEANA